MSGAPVATEGARPAPTAPGAAAATRSSRGLREDAWLGFTLFGLSLWLQIVAGSYSFDEGWFLQVVRRVLGGDALYRDVAFGVTPLSLYVTALLCRIFGAEAVVLRGAQALLFSLTALLSLRILRRLGIRGGAPELIWVLALFAWAPAGVTLSFYTPLATLCLLATLLEVLRWLQSDEPRATRAAILGGLWTGAAFATKQNVGVLAFAALAASLLLLAPKERAIASRARDVARAALAAAFATGVALAPVLLSGALRGFIDYAFLAKPTYLRTAWVGPLSTLREWWQLLAASGTLKGLRAFLPLQAPLLPLLAFGGLAGLSPLWLRAHRPTMAVLLFSLAGYLCVYPRFDWPHLFSAVPMLLIAAAHAVILAFAHGARRAGRIVVIACLAMAAAGALSRVTAALAPSDSTIIKRSQLPGLRGVWVAAPLLDGLEREVACLDALIQEAEPAFLLSARAGLLWLTLGRSNPTPFDYPLVTTLGPRGEDALIAAVAVGTIRSVYVEAAHRRWSPELWPMRFEHYLASHWQDAGTVCGFVVYRKEAGRKPAPAEPAPAAGPNPATRARPAAQPGLVFRFWHGRLGDHFFTTDPAGERAEAFGYVYQGAPFRLFALGTPGTQPLYRWYSEAAHDHFYTTDPTGERAAESGYVVEGVLGAIATTRQPKTTALYRFWNQRIRDHFYTTEPTGESPPLRGYRFEGITGYVTRAP